MSFLFFVKPRQNAFALDIYIANGADNRRILMGNLIFDILILSASTFNFASISNISFCFSSLYLPLT